MKAKAGVCLLVAGALAARDCRAGPLMPRMSLDLGQMDMAYQKRYHNVSRFLTTNHKTGTMLAMCMAEASQQALAVASFHAARGFSLAMRQVNLVRDPFIMVDSAYMYHSRKPEVWSRTHFCDIVGADIKLAPTYRDYAGRLYVPGSEGEHSARVAYYWFRRLASHEAFHECMTSHRNMPSQIVELRLTESYGDALQRLPTSYGLLLEMLRTFHRDLPFVLSSAQDCFATKPHCVSVLLDDLITDTGHLAREAIERLVLGPLGLGEGLAVDLETRCDVGRSRRRFLASDVSSLQTSDFCQSSTLFRVNYTQLFASPRATALLHRTAACAGRRERVAYVRHLDDIFFAKELARTRDVLLALVLRPEVVSPANKLSVVRHRIHT